MPVGDEPLVGTTSTGLALAPGTPTAASEAKIAAAVVTRCLVIMWTGLLSLINRRSLACSDPTNATLRRHREEHLCWEWAVPILARPCRAVPPLRPPRPACGRRACAGSPRRDDQRSSRTPRAPRRSRHCEAPGQAVRGPQARGG